MKIPPPLGCDHTHSSHIHVKISFTCKEMLDPSQAVTERHLGCDDVPEPPSSPGESGPGPEDSCFE